MPILIEYYRFHTAKKTKKITIKRVNKAITS